MAKALARVATGLLETPMTSLFPLCAGLMYRVKLCGKARLLL